jgi:DnaK suppressor protein
MNPTALESYRRQLQALLGRMDRERQGLHSEALRATGGEAGGGLSNVPLHPADLGSQHFDEEILLTVLTNQQGLEEEINAALARIEEGAFGACEACGKAISAQRLQAVPYTRFCRNCAVRNEPPPRR